MVKGGETFFGLSQKYNITIDDLKRYNLDLYIRELQEGERITIPLFSKTAEMVQKSEQRKLREVLCLQALQHASRARRMKEKKYD